MGLNTFAHISLVISDNIYSMRSDLGPAQLYEVVAQLLLPLRQHPVGVVVGADAPEFTFAPLLHLRLKLNEETNSQTDTKKYSYLQGSRIILDRYADCPITVLSFTSFFSFERQMRSAKQNCQEPRLSF